MKKLNIKLIALCTVLLAWGCTYEFPPQTQDNPGSADFTKYVAIGNSLTAGYQAQSLYTNSQDNSLPAILAQQFAMVGGGDFNQPDIESEHGYSGENGPIIFGRLVFGDDGSGPSPVPVGLPGLGVPNNSGDPITAYTGALGELNNFGVPGMKIIHAQVPGYGQANPYFGRFMSSPTATVLGDATDAITNGGTFFTMWLGNNDVLGYATSGAVDPADLTDINTFTAAYNAAVSAVLTAGPDAKGVLANIPNVTDIPYFSTVPYNSIAFDPNDPVDVATVDALNNGFAAFNATLTAAVGNGYLTQDQADEKELTWILGANGAMLNDESSIDLGPFWDILVGGGQMTPTQRAQLDPYRQARLANSEDLLTLTSATVLGTAGPAPGTTYGVNWPIGDAYALVPSEITEIGMAVDAYNAVIQKAVDDNSGQLALVDINAVLEELKLSGVSVNGSSLVASIIPPFGAFSPDGVHPNTRAYAYLANEFLKVINSKFGAQIPYTNPNDYLGNDLPYPLIP